MRILLMFFIFLSSVTSQAAPYFKYKDKNGEIIYSDTPPYPGAEPLNAPKLQTTPAIKPKPKAKSKPKAEEKPETKYLLLEIYQPQNDETIRDNEGNIPVTLKLIPELNSKEGHYINFYLDDKLIRKNSSSVNITMDNVDRGSHNIKAEIRNKKGKLLKTSASSSFHLHRLSKLHKQPQAAP